MFKSPKKPAPLPGARMDRQETVLWLGRALSSNQVALQAILQVIHVVGVQQQAIQALARRLEGQSLEQDQQDALDEVMSAPKNELLSRLTELESDLEPVLKAVEQACATLEKEIR